MRLFVDYFRFSVVLVVGFVAGTVTATAKIAAAVETKALQECNISADDATGLKGDAATDVHATSRYEDTVRGLLKQGKLDELDCIADSARSHKEKFSGGMWKIHLLYWGLSDPQPENVHATESDWQGLLANLQQWVNTKPNSVTARIALASAYAEYAWAARGDGYSNTVSDSGWRLFGERLAKARQLLDEADRLPTKCPEWFVAMLDVALGEGWNFDEIHSLYDKAVAFEPGYYYYYRQFGNLLLPKWFGEQGDTERFAEQVANEAGGDRGDALYFQIATKLICGCSDQPKMSLPRIVKGFNASERLYGPSMLNLNLIAKLATQSAESDPVTAQSAFTRIGDQWDEETWGTKEHFDSIKTWIDGYAPVVARRQTMEKAAEANLKTEEGSRYRTVFEKKYRKIVQQCDKTDGNDIDNMETLTSVGLDGVIQDMKIYSNSVIAMCVYQKLQAFKQQKTHAFPAPPHDGYWVRLNFTKSDFSPVAAK